MSKAYRIQQLTGQSVAIEIAKPWAMDWESCGAVLLVICVVELQSVTSHISIYHSIYIPRVPSGKVLRGILSN